MKAIFLGLLAAAAITVLAYFTLETIGFSSADRTKAAEAVRID